MKKFDAKKAVLILPLLALPALAFLAQSARESIGLADNEKIFAPQKTSQAKTLTAKFKAATPFDKQFEIARELVRLGDKSVFEKLVPLSKSPSRSERCNAAFVLARFAL